jgi:hypothetical protein
MALTVRQKKKSAKGMDGTAGNRKQIVRFVIGAYLIASAFIFTPYYNWQYASQNGIVSWLRWGEVKSTLKAFAWPYFTFEARDVKRTVSGKGTSSDGNTGKYGRYRILISRAAEKEQLSESDLKSIQDEQQEFVAAGEKMTAVVDYQYELGQSCLLSWDERTYLTTNRFNGLYEVLKKNNLRDEKLLSADLRRIAASSRHQNVVEDEDGHLLELDRDMILEGIRNLEAVRESTHELYKTMQEVVQ